jgi:hypothetical protein
MAATTNAAPDGPVFPLPLTAYQDGHLAGFWAVLKHRIEVAPFNLWATLLFFGAVLHTFLTHRFLRLAHWLAHRHQHRRQAAGTGADSLPEESPLARAFHFLGEVEVVFGLWVVPLLLMMTARFGRTVTAQYIEETVHYQEAIFVVVIMTMAATRPILELTEKLLGWTARLAGSGTPTAWWATILIVAPVFGSFITEPAAMTIAASLLAARFYSLKPPPALAYGTLGLLFVNVSIGGTLTHFAAPPVLMVAAPWGWTTRFMLQHFAWKALLAIVASTAFYGFLFRKQLASLGSGEASTAGASGRKLPVPAWITLVHVLFMAYAVLNAHQSAQVVLIFLFFLAFYEVTQDYQSELALRPAILVGFFLAGLVIHGGLQGWWLAPLLQGLNQNLLALVGVVLTAFNDNAAVTFLATLVPNLSLSAQYLIVAAAVTGGGLTVIANAPNPAGHSVLNRFFDEGIAPLGLLLGALPPTLIAGSLFFIFR